MISPTRRLHRNDGRPLAMLSRRRSRAASRATSWPSTVTLPESGVSRVARIDRSVVFPAPFGPSSPTMAPRGTVSDTPRSAAVRVGRSHPDLKVFVTSRASIASTGPDGNMRCMTTPGEWRCAAASVPPGRSATFRLECGGRRVSGFVVNFDGGYHAYLNRCAHVGTPLDLWPNEFFTEDGQALICSTHGALYEPISGRCTAGPCVGDHLTALPLALDVDALVVNLPPLDDPPRSMTA